MDDLPLLIILAVAAAWAAGLLAFVLAGLADVLGIGEYNEMSVVLPAIVIAFVVVMSVTWKLLPK